MARHDSILEAIGRTPLIRLRRMGAGIASPIWLKVEMLNPGGSIKDRIAVAMVEAAERDGRLKPGGTIVEATAGNTGVGLAQVAAVKGYRLVAVLPDKMSHDKIALLRAYGAEVVITPSSVAPDSPESYNGVADRLAREIPGAFRADQFNNPDNPQAHYLTTGPEIWEDSGGSVGVLVAGMGTGGTISGVGRYLKERNPGITVVGADPEGSILSGDSPRSYTVEGIGEDFIPRNFDRQVVDEMIRVSDAASYHAARRLAREEGVLAGGSAGTALAAALTYAKRLREPRDIVVVLPDTGRNYLSKFHDDAWLLEHGFWQDPIASGPDLAAILARKGDQPTLITVGPQDTVRRAIQLFRDHGISQLPVVVEGGRMIGSLNEASLMRIVHEGIDPDKQDLRTVMGAPLPTLDIEADPAEAYRILLGGASAVVITARERPVNVLTRFDLIVSLAD